MFHTPQTNNTSRYDANGRAAAIAQDLERAAAGIDTAFHAARAFGAFDNVNYSGPISAASADRIMRALDGVRPRLLAIGKGPEQYVFILAAVEGARVRVGHWLNFRQVTYPDSSGSVAAELVRWLAKSCGMACCFLGLNGQEKFGSGAELPEMNLRVGPIRKPRK